MLARTARRATPTIAPATLTRHTPHHRPRTTRPRTEQRHAFTASSTRLKTICLTPPKRDLGGNPMTLEITPKAGQRLSEIMQATNNPAFALRIRVNAGGCHGFQYLTTDDTLADPANLPEDECVFRYIDDSAAAQGEDAGRDFDGPKVVVDEGSLHAVQGSKVDFVQELIGSKFEIVDNPAATNSCGCGSSFGLKL